ncbi:hypothetical protein D9M73_54110 [compost metagenome]
MRLGRCRHLVVVAVQPAIGGTQHGYVGLFGLQHFDLGFAGAAQFACKTGHHFIAVGNQGFKRFLVGHRLDGAEQQLGRHLLDRGQAHFFHRADIDPADVELVGFDRELGRRGVGMVVVVQLFAANHDAPGRNVGAGIRCLEVAVAPVVADTVDDAGCRHGNPGHLDSPHSQASRAKQGQIDDHHQAHALPAVAGVQIAFNPVVRRAMAVLGHGFLVLAFGAIQLGTFPEHLLDAVGLRAVRVFSGLALGVVLAVNGYPFLGDLAGTQPQPETEEVRRDGVQIHCTVRLMAVQVDRHAGDRDVCRHQRVQHNLPPAGIE